MYGACLTQQGDGDEKPIYYLSHKLSKSQCKWSVVEKETFGSHFALQKLDYYLHNAQFVIKTDHKHLKYLLESPMQNKKIQLWALGMSGYNCTVEYIAGKTNTCAIFFLDIHIMLKLSQKSKILNDMLGQSSMLMTICMKLIFLIQISSTQGHLHVVNYRRPNI